MVSWPVDSSRSPWGSALSKSTGWLFSSPAFIPNIPSIKPTFVGLNTFGNSSSCTAVVTVEDNTPPIAVCQSLTVQLDAAGNASITPAQVNNGSSDACGIASYEFVSSPGYVCATGWEHQYFSISAPTGAVFTSIAFASYGRPTGTCGNYSIGCQSANSMSVMLQKLIGNNSTYFKVENYVFGSPYPCWGIQKKLVVFMIWSKVLLLHKSQIDR